MDRKNRGTTNLENNKILAKGKNASLPKFNKTSATFYDNNMSDLRKKDFSTILKKAIVDKNPNFSGTTQDGFYMNYTDKVQNAMTRDSQNFNQTTETFFNESDPIGKKLSCPVIANSSKYYGKYSRCKNETVNADGVIFFQDKTTYNEEYNMYKKVENYRLGKAQGQINQKKSLSNLTTHRASQNMVNYAQLSKTRRLEANNIRVSDPTNPFFVAYKDAQEKKEIESKVKLQQELKNMRSQEKLPKDLISPFRVGKPDKKRTTHVFKNPSFSNNKDPFSKTYAKISTLRNERVNTDKNSDRNNLKLNQHRNMNDSNGITPRDNLISPRDGNLISPRDSNLKSGFMNFESQQSTEYLRSNLGGVSELHSAGRGFQEVTDLPSYIAIHNTLPSHSYKSSNYNQERKVLLKSNTNLKIKIDQNPNYRKDYEEESSENFDEFEGKVQKQEIWQSREVSQSENNVVDDEFTNEN